MKKLLIAIMMGLSVGACSITPPKPVYTTEQIQQADTLEKKADLALSNGFAAALAAVRSINENEQAGIITRERARKYMEQLNPMLEAMNEASKLVDKGLFEQAINKAEIQKKLIDLMVKELIDMRDTQ